MAGLSSIDQIDRVLGGDGITIGILCRATNKEHGCVASDLSRDAAACRVTGTQFPVAAHHYLTPFRADTFRNTVSQHMSFTGHRRVPRTVWPMPDSLKSNKCVETGIVVMNSHYLHRLRALDLDHVASRRLLL